MTTKAEIIAKIQTAFDASGKDQLRIGMGAPGAHVLNVNGESEETGQAWEPEPKTWPLIIAGLAEWLDDAGVSIAVKDKLNELVNAYDQLREDFNSSTVPTTAPEVDPLP
jgi:hypothetical protein